jgi:hypothetical protein
MPRKRLLVYLFGLPIFMLELAGLLSLLWQITLRWTSSTNTSEQIILLVGGTLVTVIEIVLAYVTLRFARWALNRKPNTNIESDEESQSKPP